MRGPSRGPRLGPFSDIDLLSAPFTADSEPAGDRQTVVGEVGDATVVTWSLWWRGQRATRRFSRQFGVSLDAAWPRPLNTPQRPRHAPAAGAAPLPAERSLRASLW